MKDSVIILSGGMDSVTMLYDYKDRIALAISFDYGSNHNNKEIPFARLHCERLGIRHIVIPLSFMTEYFKSSLLSGADDIPEGNYADDLDGGSLTYFSDGSRDYKYGLKLGSNAGYLQINLSSALANGDVITFDQGTGTNQISFTTTSTRSTTPATSGDTYTVTAGDGLADSKTLYVWRASGSTTYVKELTIASAGAVSTTYSVAFDTQSIADDIETLEEQTTLPNPLPTPTNVTDGYTFEGWYTNAELTAAATAGAATRY